MFKPGDKVLVPMTVDHQWMEYLVLKDCRQNMVADPADLLPAAAFDALRAALEKILAHECQERPCMACADVARAALALARPQEGGGK